MNTEHGVIAHVINNFENFIECGKPFSAARKVMNTKLQWTLENILSKKEFRLLYLQRMRRWGES